MTVGTPGQLRFYFNEVLQEIDALRELTLPFTAPRSAHVLSQLAGDLEGLWDAAPDRQIRWSLSEFWTRVSNGEYEAQGRRGPRHVVGCISGQWDIRALGTRVKKPKEKQKRIVEYCGIASTRVCVFDEDDHERPIAMWRVELGDAGSPGCYFHVQVLGEEDEPPFPKSLSIPRLPSIFMSPMGVIEFLIGELFQDLWAKAAAEETGQVKRWTGLQRWRLLKLLDWQKEVVEGAMTSPWMSLKLAKPHASLFLP